jgi:oligopeptide transport system substrate-binding protein
MYDAEKIVLQQAAIYPLYTQCNVEMVSAKVKGIAYHPIALNRVFKDAEKTS